MKVVILLFSLLFCFKGLSQKLDAKTLINKSIEFHDPDGKWRNLNIKYQVTSEKGAVQINVQNNKGSMEWTEKLATGDSLTGGFKSDSCFVKLNGKSIPTTGKLENFLLDCDQIINRSNYWLFMYGLPMKLKDFDIKEVQEPRMVSFLGNDYLMIEVKYKSSKDSFWKFYFDPKSYRFSIAQYFHNALGSESEYIVFKDNITLGGIKMAKKRIWHLFPKRELIGTETLEPLE